MALIVEDGTGVANADSYVSLANARAYATKRGLVLNAVDATLEQHLIAAMDWLESKRDLFQGYKTEANQSLQWPRTEVYIDEVDFPIDEIPKELVNAQIELAVYLNDGQALYPNGPDSMKASGLVTRKIVGPLETHYADNKGTSIGLMPDGSYSLPRVMPYLNVLFKKVPSLRTTRI